MERDEFFWLNRLSEATVVVGLQHGQFTHELATRALQGIATLEAQGKSDPKVRVTRYIDWEPRFLALTGPELSVIHAGRSSQDMLSTLRTALFRDRLIDILHAFDAMLTHWLTLAETHRDTVVPSYTNGVAAQPTSLGHTFLAHISSLLRARAELTRVLCAYNRSAMGAMVLNGTRWPLDRKGMATALGFEAPVENAFDATCFAPVDFVLAASAPLAQIAVRLGSFLADVMVQYAQPRPWILLAEGGENTYISSAMPQKRNPGLINNCREAASDVVANATVALTRAHNVTPGMTDGKSVAKNRAILEAFRTLVTQFDKVLSALRINADRALEELNLDWTGSQEVADRLMLEHHLPFRVGHHMASRLVTFARQQGFTPLTVPYEDVVRLYRDEITTHFPEADPVFPMSEAAFRAALDPREIVRARATAGSAAPEQVDQLLASARSALKRETDAVDAIASQRDAALRALEQHVKDVLTA